MNRLATWAIAGLAATAASLPAADFPPFKTQEIATDLTIGYAVIAADLNGDGKPDVVVVDKHRVVWYENPTWKPRTILQGKTKPDNVCVAALDVDGDGQLDLVLGAGWGAGTAVPGTVQWLKRGKALDDEWALHPIPCDEPTVHRFRVADVLGLGKPQLIVAPLQGKGATAKGNWTDGRPVRILAYPIPTEPTKPEAWKPTVISEELYVVHNIWTGAELPKSIAAASYDGVSLIVPEGEKHRTVRFHPANQETPKGSRGASEIARAEVPGLGGVVATVEPWHGNQVVVYYRTGNGPRATVRRVIDSDLRWGHAVRFADLDGDGTPEVIAGVRDDPNPKAGDTYTQRRGVRVYKCTDGKGEKWDRLLLDEGGVAVEDLTVADLNGDGKPDVVAVGRATGNCRIYWNQGAK
jgi:hypothetical protein